MKITRIVCSFVVIIFMILAITNIGQPLSYVSKYNNNQKSEIFSLTSKHIENDNFPTMNSLQSINNSVIANQTFSYLGVINESNTTITQNTFKTDTISKSSRMILIENSNNIEISYNSFLNTSVLVILVVNSEHIRIHNNKLHGNHYWHGIQIVNSSSVSVKSNVITQMISGVLVHDSNFLVVHNNTITNTAIGINAFNSNDVMITNNLLEYGNFYLDENETSFFTCGSIQFSDDGRHILIAHNKISKIRKNFGICINLDNENNTIIYNNTISETDQAAIFAYLIQNSIISHNSIFNTNGGIFLIRNSYTDFANNISIFDNLIYNCSSFGISTGPIRNLTIERNLFQNISSDDYDIASILLPSTAENIFIRKNKFKKLEVGVEGGSSLSVTNNTFEEISDNGIYIWKSSESFISQNIFTNVMLPIKILRSEMITISSNEFIEINSDIIQIRNSKDIKIIDNIITHSTGQFISRDIFSIHQLEVNNNTIDGEPYKYTYYKTVEVIVFLIAVTLIIITGKTLVTKYFNLIVDRPKSNQPE